MKPTVFSTIGVAASELFLPAESVSLTDWSVIACDQHTSDFPYWEDVEEKIQNKPSTGHLILPEVYLETKSEKWLQEKINTIRANMNAYLESQTLQTYPCGFILTNRETSLHPSRKGLILCIDLDEYDYTPGSKKKIRATEGTILSRIPPRVKIRKDSPLELPHVLLLLDDPLHQVIDVAWNALSSSGEPLLYDTPLMKGGGHIKGYYVNAESEHAKNIVKSLETLYQASEDGLLFAVGDGNHSLATAKAHWDALSPTLSSEEREHHPARFALTEVINIHDKGLDFEPIHRVAFHFPLKNVLEKAGEYFKDQSFMWVDRDDFQKESILSSLSKEAHCFPLYSCAASKEPSGILIVDKPQASLPVETLQGFLDASSKESSLMSIDYIHGEEAVSSLSNENDTGFLSPPISKDDFFSFIAKSGVFPRKTFSMGEAFEKRYYMEAKKII